MRPGGSLPEPWHDPGRKTASRGRNRGPHQVSQATTAPQGQKEGAPPRSARGSSEASPPVSPDSARAIAEHQRSDAPARPSAPPHQGSARRPRTPDAPHRDNAATTTTTANLLILSGLAAPEIGISGNPRIQPSGWDATPRAEHEGNGTRSRSLNKEEDNPSTGKVRAPRPSENQHPADKPRGKSIERSTDLPPALLHLADQPRGKSIALLNANQRSTAPPPALLPLADRPRGKYNAILPPLVETSPSGVAGPRATTTPQTLRADFKGRIDRVPAEGGRRPARVRWRRACRR